MTTLKPPHLVVVYKLFQAHGTSGEITPLLIGGVADCLTRPCRSSVGSPISCRLGGIAGAIGGPTGIDPIATAADRPMAGCPAAVGAAGVPARFITRRSCRS
eukprot:766863-Pyramimonas_sp.AAC.2